MRSTPPHPALRATFSHGRRKWICVFCLGGWDFVRKGRKRQFDDREDRLEVLHDAFVEGYTVFYQKAQYINHYRIDYGSVGIQIPFVDW